MVHIMSHATASAATIPLLPARRSFLMVDGDFILPSSTPRSLVEPLSIHPISPSIDHTHTHPPVVRHHLSMLTPSYFLRFLLLLSPGTICCYCTGILHCPPRDSPIPHVLSTQAFPHFLFLFLLPLVFRASHAEVVCFRVRVGHIWVETIKHTARLDDVLAICSR